MRDIRIMDEETSVFEHIENLIILVAVIVVLLLKLLGVITISWFWLLSPFWLLGGFMFVLLFMGILIGTILAIIEKVKEKKDERY